MNVVELLDGLIDNLLDNNATEIKGIALDSRKIKKDFVFIAVAGAVEHGLVYAKQAVENGAFAIIYEACNSEQFALQQFNCYLVKVDGLSLKLGGIADQFYHSPSRALDVIGVTGTNGKTTCSQFLAQLIPDSGVIGTLGWGKSGELTKTLNTTPDALDVQKILADLLALKKKTVVMEVSSHGLEQGRVNAVNFKGAVFTNLSRDHLDYHGSMDAYLEAKLALFKRPELQFVVVNTDDVKSKQFLEITHSKVKHWAFSATGRKSELAENIVAEDVRYSLEGIEFFACWKQQRIFVQTKIVGDFNLENILAVICVLLAQGDSLDLVTRKIGKLIPVVGRMECFGGDDSPFVIVDYAHTPNALETVLLGLRKYCSQKLWLIFGCGGDRDKGKRSQMGAVAEQFADKVIITDDNPRLESSEQIISDIVCGFIGHDYEVIKNREKAIQSVINRADKSDCIVIAGKGHENYQDIHGVKYEFSDQVIVHQSLLGIVG